MMRRSRKSLHELSARQLKRRIKNSICSAVASSVPLSSSSSLLPPTSSECSSPNGSPPVSLNNDDAKSSVSSCDNLDLPPGSGSLGSSIPLSPVDSSTSLVNPDASSSPVHLSPDNPSYHPSFEGDLSSTNCLVNPSSPAYPSSPVNPLSADKELQEILSEEHDNFDTFKKFLMVCDECERCSLCSCFLQCDCCVHAHEGLVDCVHCDQCNDVWIRLCSIDHAGSSEHDVVSDSDDETEEQSLRVDLAEWAVKCPNISHISLNKLLSILKRHHPEDDIPSDARTLLATARHITVIDVAPGHYWNNGLKRHLIKLFTGSVEKEVKVTVNIDGLLISDSSGSCMWPVLYSVNGTHSEEVYVAGIYHGYAKPHSANEYLQPFVNDLTDLVENGLIVDNKHLPVSIHGFVCDAPAKSFVLNVKSHNGYYGCTKCCQKGKMLDKRMSFPDTAFIERTDDGFLNKEQPGHHLPGDSILLDIPGCKPVTHFALDPMHLLYLGVMKKLLLFWILGPHSVRIGKSLRDEISVYLDKLASFIPVEFARKTRSLEHVRRFKATEFRLLLLYVGPVVFRKLPQPIFENFLCLHFAVRLLSSPHLCQEYNDYAGSLMVTFVTNFKIIYGEQYVSHNIHNCLHINKEVTLRGHLELFSAFKYENFLGRLKGLIRQGNKPLQQVAKRYSEANAVGESLQKKTVSDEFLREHNKGPVVTGCGYPQFQLFKWNGFELNVNHEANCCVSLKDGSIVVVKNFAYNLQEKEIVIVGSKYIHKEDLYSVPCASSALSTFKVHGESKLYCWPTSSISHKVVRLPYKANVYAVFPILHAERCTY